MAVDTDHLRVWERRERGADYWSWLALAFCLGMVANSAYVKVPVLWAKKNELTHEQTVVVPTLKKQVFSEHIKAVIATKNEMAIIKAVSADGPNAGVQAGKVVKPTAKPQH